MADIKDVKDVAVSSQGTKIFEWTYDFAEDGGATGKLNLGVCKEKLLVHRAWIKVGTAVTSTGDPTVSIGATTAGDAAIVPTTLKAAMAINLVVDSAADQLNVLLLKDEVLAIEILVAALTAGRFTICMELSQFDEG